MKSSIRLNEYDNQGALISDVFKAVKAELPETHQTDCPSTVLTTPKLFETYLAKYHELRENGAITTPGEDFEGPCGMTEEAAISSLQSKVEARFAALQILDEDLYVVLTDEQIIQFTVEDLEAINQNFTHGELKALAPVLPGLGSEKINFLGLGSISPKVAKKIGREALTALSIDQLNKLKTTANLYNKWTNYLLEVLELMPIRSFLALNTELLRKIQETSHPEPAILAIAEDELQSLDTETLERLSQLRFSEEQKAAIQKLNKMFVLHCSAQQFQDILKSHDAPGWQELVARFSSEYLLAEDDRLKTIFASTSGFIVTNLDKFSEDELQALPPERIRLLIRFAKHSRVVKMSKEALAERSEEVLNFVITELTDKEFQRELTKINDSHQEIHTQELVNRRSLHKPVLKF